MTSVRGRPFARGNTLARKPRCADPLEVALALFAVVPSDWKVPGNRIITALSATVHDAQDQLPREELEIFVEDLAARLALLCRKPSTAFYHVAEVLGFPPEAWSHLDAMLGEETLDDPRYQLSQVIDMAAAATGRIVYSHRGARWLSWTDHRKA